MSGSKERTIYTWCFLLLVLLAFFPAATLAQVVIEEEIKLTPDSTQLELFSGEQNISAASMSSGVLSFPVKQDGVLKLVFEEGRRFGDHFGKNTRLRIRITDTDDKPKHTKVHFPEDFFSEPIQGRLTPECTEPWYLYGKGPFEWQSGSSESAIDDARVFSLGCDKSYAESTGNCRTTNSGSVGDISATAWTWHGDPALIRSFVKFNGLEFSGPVQLDEARLNLYETGGRWGSSELSGSNDFIVSRVSSDWDEYTVTWVNMPGVSSPHISGPPGTSNVELDVAPIVQSWLDSPGSNHGIRLALENEQYYRSRSFNSSENSSPPQLQVTVSNPGASSDTLEVAFVQEGDVVAIDYESNGEVLFSNTEMEKMINGESVAGRQLIFSIAGPSCGDVGFSERLQAFAWVEQSPLTLKIPEPKEAWPTLLADDVHPQFDDLSVVENILENIEVEVNRNGTPVSGQTVTVNAEWIPFTGGHDHGGNENSMPTRNNMGLFQLANNQKTHNGGISATTNQDGLITLSYTTPEFGGQVELVATTNLDGKQVVARDTLTIRVPDLELLPEKNHYEKIGGTCNHSGPRLDNLYENCRSQDNNHWAHPTVAAWLDSIAVRYHQEYPDEDLIRYNDISLPNGGGFDINARWNVNIEPRRTGHQYHRLGKSVDIRTNPPQEDGIPLTLLEDFRNIVRIFNSTAEVDVHGQRGNRHFHIDFDF